MSGATLMAYNIIIYVLIYVILHPRAFSKQFNVETLK